MSKKKRQKVHEVDLYVGGRIRMLRLWRRMSQAELAAKLELTFQQVQKYEKGANRVSSSTLYEIATVLGVPVSYFFKGLEASRAAASAAAAQGGEYREPKASYEGSLADSATGRYMAEPDIEGLDFGADFAQLEGRGGDAAISTQIAQLIKNFASIKPEARKNLLAVAEVLSGSEGSEGVAE